MTVIGTKGGNKVMGVLTELVEGAVPVTYEMYDADTALEQAVQLDELGFCTAAKELSDKARLRSKLGRLAKEKYVKITSEMIQNFVDRKAAEYDASHPGQPISLRTTISGTVVSFSVDSTAASWPYYYNELSLTVGPKSEFFVAKTKDYFSYSSGLIGQFRWMEDRIDQVKTLPPSNVLKKLADEKAKNLFDYFTVARLEGLPDPLLLGRLNGVTDRFFITQWDNDICLDDLL